jgi:hypothetical protein
VPLSFANDLVYIHMGGYVESFFDVKIWRLAVKPSTCFAQNKLLTSI